MLPEHLCWQTGRRRWDLSFCQHRWLKAFIESLALSKFMGKQGKDFFWNLLNLLPQQSSCSEKLMRFHSEVDENLSVTPNSSLNHPERSEGRIANCYSLKVWMHPVSFSVDIKKLKVLKESRKDVQHGGVSSVGHWEAPGGHLLLLAGISSQNKLTVCQTILIIRRFPPNNILSGVFLQRRAS